jgi:hypothetical protein
MPDLRLFSKLNSIQNVLNPANSVEYPALQTGMSYSSADQHFNFIIVKQRMSGSHPASPTNQQQKP